MMEIKNVAFEIEELSYLARAIDSMQEVFYQAIFLGNSTPEPYKWAIDSFGEVTNKLYTQISSLRDNLFNELQK